MSLQICPKCGKTNSYWNTYKEINCKRFQKGMSMKCEYCECDMVVDLQEKDKITMLCTGFLWMTFPLIIIYLALTARISYLLAIVIVIIYHLGAMYYIIKKMKYKK